MESTGAPSRCSSARSETAIPAGEPGASYAVETTVVADETPLELIGPDGPERRGRVERGGHDEPVLGRLHRSSPRRRQALPALHRWRERAAPVPRACCRTTARRFTATSRSSASASTRRAAFRRRRRAPSSRPSSSAGLRLHAIGGEVLDKRTASATASATATCRSSGSPASGRSGRATTTAPGDKATTRHRAGGEKKAAAKLREVEIPATGGDDRLRQPGRRRRRTAS